MRKKLFHIYQDEIKKTAVPSGIVKGKGDTRFNNALEIVNRFLDNQNLDISGFQ